MPSALLKRLLTLALLPSLLLIAMPPARAAELSPVEILTRCDQARGNQEGVSWQVEMTAVEGGKARSRTLQVKARYFDVVAETLAPAQRRGQMLILVQGNMWFYKPDLSKPVPISQRQKLLGLAVNGDISSTNYARDYEILDLRETALDGQDCYLFELKARTAGTTYSRIRYWVDKQRLVGVRADFYNPQGDKRLKSAQMEYANRIETPDGPRPFISRMLIRDELLSADTTTLSFGAPLLGPIPAHIFNLNLLRK